MARFKRCTIVDVAHKAGVSRSTAGHILRNTPALAERFSDETRERVWACARELAYTPHLAAAALRTGQTGLLAMIVEGPWLEEDGDREVAGDIKAAQWSLVAAMIRHAHERGKMPLMDILRMHTGAEDMEMISHLTGAGMGGLVIKSPHPDANKLLDQLARGGFPVVALYPQSRKGLSRNWLDTDNVRAGRMAAEHLLRQGFTTFHWGESDTTEASRDRLAGVKAALQQAGMGDRLRQWSYEGSDYGLRIQTMRQMLSASERCAVITADSSAHHVAMVALDLGRRFPYDVGLVGHDCHLWHASVPVPQITTITVSQEYAGRSAVDLACDLMDDEEPRANPVVFEPTLVQGETTEPVAENATQSRRRSMPCDTT